LGKHSEEITADARKLMRLLVRISLAALIAVALLGIERECPAQATQTAKGIAGGALLGADVVLLTEAAFGVQPAWPYIVGGIAGAGGGVVGGYYIGRGSSNKPPAFLLAGGIALMMPTMIAILTATHFEPPDTYLQDVAPEDELLDEPPPVGAEDAPGARLGWPSFAVEQAFSPDELQKFGVRQATELHLAALRGTF
jgi:hypothetical protein